MGFNLPLLSRRRIGGFSPRAIIGGSTALVWLDPSDLSTLFQDAAGTTPVTAPGQPVGLALDKSKGLVLGSEQSPALPDYQTVLTGTWAASGANYVFTDTVGGQARPGIQWPTTSLAAGSYQIVVVVAAINGATQIRLDGVGATDQLLTVGSNTRIVSVTSTSRPRFRLEDLSTTIGDSFTITSISVRELPGFHATQATAASRPTYGVVPSRGRVNLLTRTEEFDNAVWSKSAAGTGVAPTVTANAALAPDNTMTADRVDFNRGAGNLVADRSLLTQAPSGITSTTYVGSIWLKAATSGDIGKQIGIRTVGSTTYGVVTLTDDWVRVTRVETGSSSNFELASRGTATADNQVSVLIWGAQLELGSTASPYQRVGSQFDVTDPAGFPTYPCHYLSFDGVDDFLVTPTITPNADKVQVFAGVRKLSDAAAGMIVEHSASVGSNAGTFYMTGPESTGSSGDFSFKTRGSVNPAVFASSGVRLAPVTAVLSGLGDISGDLATLRVNGTQAAQSTADQGTGNFLAYPLYIGRRGGTSLPFNGQLFGLIVRFSTANLDAGLISNTERWMAGKTPIDAASEVTWNDSTDTYTQRLYNGFGV